MRSFPLSTSRICQSDAKTIFNTSFEYKIDRFMSTVLSRHVNLGRLPSGDQDEEHEHLHLLEASHMLFVSDFRGTHNPNPGRALRLLRLLRCKKGRGEDHADIEAQNSFRTATDLRAKGIRFKPSHNGVDFQSYFFFATLRLPSRAITTHTKVLLKNMVAYELMPHTWRGGVLHQPHEVAHRRARRPQGAAGEENTVQRHQQRRKGC